MTKKKYVAPEIVTIELEPTQMLAGSGDTGNVGIEHSPGVVEGSSYNGMPKPTKIWDKEW